MQQENSAKLWETQRKPINPPVCKYLFILPWVYRYHKSLLSAVKDRTARRQRAAAMPPSALQSPLLPKTKLHCWKFVQFDLMLFRRFPPLVAFSIRIICGCVLIQETFAKFTWEGRSVLWWSKKIKLFLCLITWQYNSSVIMWINVCWMYNNMATGKRARALAFLIHYKEQT
jgi:hypothetical protein